MPLQHPKGPQAPGGDRSIAPTFTFEGDRRRLPRLRKQPEPVHDGTGATGFHH